MIRRTNMVARQAENWRPPAFTVSKGGLGSFIAVLRRLLDLQTASIWADLSRVLPTATGTVLDVGCGAQPFRSLLPPAVRYIGIDTVDAKANFGYEVPDTVYFEGSVWPVADGSIDFVLCTEVFEHVADSHAFLAEMFRCLAPGAQVVLTVPFSARWHYIPYDYWRFTPASLNNLFSEAGFMDIAVYARGNALTVACYKLNALILPLLMPQGKGFAASLLLRLAGFLVSPIFLLSLLIAHLSLRGLGGDDCLGYTLIARKTRN
ncbi:MAG TPA: class I SAM-dependent methyltransferase [Bryobacteraceae bacterium]|jgi:SAM-dependent methyltransferase|nr:class I SAM-dependent methyltransferase [Bryobacteraceae bacterium]